MGKILLENDNLKSELIPDEERNATIQAFCQMYIAAVRSNDKFYTTESSYSDGGALLRYFEDWPNFVSHDYSRNISQTTFQQLYDMFMHHPYPDAFRCREEFYSMDGLLGEGGYRIPGISGDVIVDVLTWRLWRKAWFLGHPEEIDWTQAKDECHFLPNIESVNDILQSEILCHIAADMELPVDDEKVRSEYHRIIDSDETLHDLTRPSCPLKSNHLALLFHKMVMSAKAKGGERQGYAKEIADRICPDNYYHEAADLSAMEKDAAPANNDDIQRSVYYIKKGVRNFLFMSIDFEKGMFEFHDNDGTHLGEFHYDGSRNAPADKNGLHDLRCVRSWKRQHHFD